MSFLREYFWRQWSLTKQERVYGLCWNISIFLICTHFVALSSYSRGASITMLAYMHSTTSRNQTHSRFWWVCPMMETYFWNDSLFQFKGSKSWSWIFEPPLAVTDAWTLNMLLHKLQPQIGTYWQLVHIGERTQPNTNVKIALYSLNLSFEAHF